MHPSSLPLWLAGLLLAPLFLGVINRVKAVFAGRQGQPLLQVYLTLWKLRHKGAVISRTTSWVFWLGPAASLAAMVLAAALLPAISTPAPVGFTGDLVLLAYAFGLARFLTVLAALDTGSSFEGMGASREAWIGAMSEPAFFLVLAALAVLGHGLSLSAALPAISPAVWLRSAPALALIGGALFLVLLAENARIPVDDPNTHLELTMIHEVMVLDHSGPDLGYITYGAALKLWIFSGLLVNVLLPWGGGTLWSDLGLWLAGQAAVAVAIGLVESTMARLRLLRIPQLLVLANAFAALALILTLR